jgi:hypothetical protein
MDEDETVTCDVTGCGKSFPDEVAWAEHYEYEHGND